MQLLRSLFGAKRGVQVRKPWQARARLALESLEDRCLAAVDAFIWFEPLGQTSQLKGETNDHHNGPAFEIKDFSFGVENPTTIGSQSGGAGTGKLHELVIKKTTESASPAFNQNCVAGEHYKVVTIELRKTSGDPADPGKAFLRYKFNTVFTTKIDWSGPGDEGPTETITFVYCKLGVKYLNQRPTGPHQHFQTDLAAFLLCDNPTRHS